MRMRSWPFLLIGFCALLGLIGLSSTALHRRMEQVRADVQALQEESEGSRRVLEELQSDIYLFAIFLRDYLLERSAAPAQHREMLEKLRDSMRNHLRALEGRRGLKDLAEIQELRSVLEEYWKAIEPVVGWTPSQRAREGLPFLRRHVIPQRQQAVKLASGIKDVSLSQSRLRQQEILRTQEDLKGYQLRVSVVTLLLGAAVAAVSIARTRSLEASAARHLSLIERNAEDLRRLSSKLSKAQEDERRSISRELHDQVGQMLTALRIELANIEEFCPNAGGRFAQHMADARKLTEETLRTIRDLSTGLRPSVLDELGLGPALKWQAREFTRRSGVSVETQIDGSFDKLPDTHRTCVYRVAQEALTNCARHAHASRIRIALKGSSTSVVLTVEDNGIGFAVPVATARGVGLLGAEERVRELKGKLEIFSQPSKGTLLRCEIPTPGEMSV